MAENQENSEKNLMEQHNRLTLDNNSSDITNKIDYKSPDFVDIILNRKETKIVDLENLVKETQKRIWAALKQGYEYDSTIIDESDRFLRNLVSSRVNMIVLYVDLVGSTEITLSLPEEKVAIIIRSFAQEMSSIIKQHDGFVLKFVGDAVIGYFIAEAMPLVATDNAVNCAKAMITVVEKGMNPILNQYDYPELKIKIGMDFGQNIIVSYGANKEKSHVDILGPTMNIASKIQNTASPNQILIGDDVYQKLHPEMQKQFKQVVWTQTNWKYHDRETGKLYPVYSFVG
ncbi:MAG TPA: adenylate/guanylate cyclase domain-containing protein [Nitrosopumilaceae archaeon]|nr:adenylate/guanylate cyclase domain-containing protein [Nitrosopumilaceae archaeon]